MLKYDPAKMVERAKGCLANKKEIIEVADKLSQEGFSNIFFIGVGGTITYAWSIQETLKPLTTLGTLVSIADHNGNRCSCCFSLKNAGQDLCLIPFASGCGKFALPRFSPV